MAGVQIDGVNNKIDFDDDLDTSISANTDDTLVIEAGGNTMATITATTFTINDGTIITTADNTDTLTLVSTDADASIAPVLNLSRNNNSAAANDFVGKINFTAEDAANNQTSYANIQGVVLDATDGSEDGRLRITSVVAGTNRNRLDFLAGETVFNEDSIDLDFRVESNGNANMLFVNGGSNLVGIGADPTLGAGLHIETANSGATATAHGDELVIEDGTSGANVGMSILSNANGEARINFGDSDDNDIGMIRYDHADNKLHLIANNTSVITLTSAEIVMNDGSNDQDFRVESNGNTHMLFVDGGNNKVGIGESANAPMGTLHIKSADSGDTAIDGNNDDLVVENDNHAGITIATPNDKAGGLYFSDPDAVASGRILYDHSSNHLSFVTDSTEQLRIVSNLATGAEAAPDVASGGLCLQLNANDNSTLTFKSSDIAIHANSGFEADTYFQTGKLSATAGGTIVRSFSEAGASDVFEFRALMGEAGNNTAKSTSANAPFMFKAADIHSSEGIRAMAEGGTNSNLFIIADHTTRRFIFDSEGDLHSDSSNTTFDSYEDAHLVRAFDLSHGRGVINSKFDEFIKYQHEDLAEAGLVGREEDGSPNHFINMSGFQRLHNGAIWQQYEKHQKLAEAVYEMAKETLGADKADEILKKHDIKLLN